MTRAINTRYADPLDEIWIAAAKRLGVQVRRAADAYAAYDGAGTLTLAEPAQLDADDSLAQLVFHELCHALLMGDAALTRPDWGLTNVDARDLVLEHACHRVQAALADRYGLRALFAVTTEHRPYWDALPHDPLAPGDDPAIERARAAFVRSRTQPWRDALHGALGATADVARAVRPHAPPGSPWAELSALHPAGMPVHRDPALRCGDCAWLMAASGRGKRARCRQTRDGGAAQGAHVDAAFPACQRFEPRLDAGACGTCGACCREGFDLVQVGPRERMRRRHPALVVEDRHGSCVPRPGGRCVALDGTGADAAPYRCRVYADRPRACADFAIGGDACLTARRRVGLSK